jgi:hypothetical protein
VPSRTLRRLLYYLLDSTRNTIWEAGLLLVLPLFLSGLRRAVHHAAGWRRVKPCDVGIDAHRLTGSQSVALRQPADRDSGVAKSHFSPRKITLRYAMPNRTHPEMTWCGRGFLPYFEPQSRSGSLPGAGKVPKSNSARSRITLRCLSPRYSLNRIEAEAARTCIGLVVPHPYLVSSP